MEAAVASNKAARKSLWLALGVLLLIRLPFLNQAIQGDDHIYLTEAQHALIDPLHPSLMTRCIVIHPHRPVAGRDAVGVAEPRSNASRARVDPRDSGDIAILFDPQAPIAGLDRLRAAARPDGRHHRLRSGIDA